MKMNQRVFQIADQAGIKRRHNDPNEIWGYESDLQNFNVHLVQEVLDIILDERFELPPEIIEAVRERMGVQ